MTQSSMKPCSPKEFAEAFRRGDLGDRSTTGLLGRVIRGKTPEDFLTLTDDPERKLILLTDPAGLSRLPGTPGFQILLAIGWDFDYAVQKINSGYQVKLAVFREGGKALLATWENVIQLVGMAYPDIAARLQRRLPELRSTTFDVINAAHGGKMNKDIDHQGKGHPDYMTYDRYVAAPDTLASARAFLYYAIHLRELFKGDGFTYDNGGTRGVREYMALNVPITELDGCELVDFDVQLPAAVRPKPASPSQSRFPSYYRPEDVGLRFTPRLDEVTEAAKSVRLRPAAKDSRKTLLVGIDLQDDFVMPEVRDVDGQIIQQAGALRVGGAVGDVRRVIELIYTYPEEISGILLTLDQHTPYQIFFPPWWRDRSGNVPAPFTMITAEAVANGDFYPVIEKAWSIEYVKQLKATNQTPLILWPFHCMIGTPGAAIVPALYEAILWHSIARGNQPMFLFKGSVAQTEHYGPFCPCVPVPSHPQGGLNTALLDQIATNDRIIIVGEAEDFCVHEGARQTKEYFGTAHQDALRRIQFLTDCTSMVFPDNRAQADAFLAEMAGQGIQITTSDKVFA